MADILFTDKYGRINEKDLSGKIIEAIAELRELDPSLSIHNWESEKEIAVALKLPVSLPSRGTVNGINILPEEPIILILNKAKYPYKAPTALSNRNNFPVDDVAHLNPTAPEQPACFCLHRGNIDDWFAEHSISDFVERVHSWLKDAACDELNRPGDDFEPIRFTSRYGINMFSEEDIIKRVAEYGAISPSTGGSAIILYDFLNTAGNNQLQNTDEYFLQNKNFIIKHSDAIRIQDACIQLNEESIAKGIGNRCLFGLLVWAAEMNIMHRYFSAIPDKLGAFLNWTDSLQIPLREVLIKYIKNDLNLLSGIPFTLVFPRPRKLIGHTTHLEIVNFITYPTITKEAGRIVWDNDSSVHAMTNLYPNSPSRAEEISGFKDLSKLGKFLMVGCGALGSKAVLHLAKSGWVKSTLVDNEIQLPHNLVRHGLLAESLWKNKAEALKAEIEKIYFGQTLDIDVRKKSIIDLLDGENSIKLQDHQFLIDATASNNVERFLTDTALPSQITYARMEIADDGNLGFLRIEGKNRNPRMDDLMMLTYDMAIQNSILSDWLQRNKKIQKDGYAQMEGITIGLSCSSDSVRLADETVSLHAASLTSGLRNQINKPRNSGNGSVRINHVDLNNNVSFHSSQVTFGPLNILKAKNIKDWEVRLKQETSEEMFSQLSANTPNETGGLLIGRVDYSRRTIYVTRVFTAPEDSIKTPYLFVRGVKGIPKMIRSIRKSTGGMLDFVGEWHTHSMGGSKLSTTDKKAVSELQSYLNKIPYPTFVLIVTPNKLHPYIFYPK